MHGHGQRRFRFVQVAGEPVHVVAELVDNELDLALAGQRRKVGRPSRRLGQSLVAVGPGPTRRFGLVVRFGFVVVREGVRMARGGVVDGVAEVRFAGLGRPH